MKAPSGYRKYHEDILVRRYRDTTEAKRPPIFVGKRVPNDCEMVKEERRAYVHGGSVAACRVIMTRRKWKLKRAFNFLKKMRGKNSAYWGCSNG